MTRNVPAFITSHLYGSFLHETMFGKYTYMLYKLYGSPIAETDASMTGGIFFAILSLADKHCFIISRK